MEKETRKKRVTRKKRTRTRMRMRIAMARKGKRATSLPRSVRPRMTTT